MKQLISKYISGVYADFYIKYLKNHNISNVKTCMDIGSNAGVFVDKLNKIGIKTEGIEAVASTIQSKDVTVGIFDTDYSSDKKYDMITLPQVIYFLGNFETICNKVKSMLNPNGVIFIVSSPNGNKITNCSCKVYPLPTRSECNEIFKRLNLVPLDYSVFQSNIGVAFNDGKIKAIFRLLSFMLRLKKPIVDDINGNHLYILLRAGTS